MLSLYYHELMRKIKEHDRSTFLMVNDYTLEKILDKIKETIDIVKLDDTKILINADDKLPDYISLKMLWYLEHVIKDSAKCHRQIILQEPLHNE